MSPFFYCCVEISIYTTPRDDLYQQATKEKEQEVHAVDYDYDYGDDSSAFDGTLLSLSHLVVGNAVGALVRACSRARAHESLA